MNWGIVPRALWAESPQCFVTIWSGSTSPRPRLLQPWESCQRCAWYVQAQARGALSHCVSHRLVVLPLPVTMPFVATMCCHRPLKDGHSGAGPELLLSRPLIGRCEQLITMQPLCGGSSGHRRLCGRDRRDGQPPPCLLFRHPEDDADTSVTTSWDGRRVKTFVYVPIIRCAPDPCLA